MPILHSDDCNIYKITGKILRGEAPIRPCSCGAEKQRELFELFPALLRRCLPYIEHAAETDAAAAELLADINALLRE